MADKLYRQVYQELKSRIQDGKYTLGSYLPSENELCNTHGITRTTARRALQELQKEGMKSLVLDLRDNPGGQLASVRAAAARFFDGDLYVEVDRDGR
mgnify:CR=1 FL=1